MWTIAALIFVIATFHRTSLGVLTKEIMVAFGVTGSLVALLSSIYFYVYAALVIPGGVLVDSLGPRLVLTSGALLMAVGTLAMGSATHVVVLVGGRLVLASGAAVAFVGTMKVAASWFPRDRFATVSGLTLSLGNVGALLGTVPFAAAATAIGWRSSFVVIGLATLVVSVWTWLVLVDAPEERDRRPAAAGREGPERMGRALRHALLGAGVVLRNRGTWPPLLTFAFLYSSWFNVLFWVVPFLRDVYGLRPATAATYAAAISLGLLGSAPTVGYFSDRVLKQRRRLYVGFCWAEFGAAALFVVTLGQLGLGFVWSLLFVSGVLGAGFALTYPLGREANPPELAGVTVSVLTFCGFLGAALSQGLIGIVLDALWEGGMTGGARTYPLVGYRAAFGICLAFNLVAALCSQMAREAES